jgi:hypothetical protein
VLAYKLAPFLRYIELPEAMVDWSLTSVQLKLIKFEARVLRHASAITFQLTDVAVSCAMVRTLLAAIRRLPAPPLCSVQTAIRKRFLAPTFPIFA